MVSEVAGRQAERSLQIKIVIAKLHIMEAHRKGSASVWHRCCRTESKQLTVTGDSVRMLHQTRCLAHCH